ncbi:hypothetical protein CMUS01_03822 [Colletotrichum musicola]|uniref:Uncharacterized protein n=1 Tax=Colletotrichum musicola TaxID=2175873 RepID=A0A8H6NQL4_9PEZI|nr:hypothetical protein CMUS01_03822 [Colletotrichum musicola]
MVRDSLSISWSATMHTQRNASPDTHGNERELVPSHPSPTSPEADDTEAAQVQESLLRGLDDNAESDTEISAIDEQTLHSRTSLEAKSCKSHASSITIAPELAGQDPISDARRRMLHFRRSAGEIFDGWWLETICCLLSIACLAALIVFLGIYDNQSLPELPSGITVNTVIALLSTIARTAFTIPVAEGLSQCKWNWFKQKPRPLRDLDLFDQASRGPWGSLSLLVRTKGWYAKLAATSMCYIRSTKLTDAVEHVMSSPFEFNVSFKQPVCPQSNCTWPRFSTLAICHSVTNITHFIQRKPSGPGLQTDLWLPNGPNMTVLREGDLASDERVVVGSGPMISDYDTDVLNSVIFVYSAIKWSKLFDPQAAEVVFHWCIKTYDAAVENNVLSLQLNQSHTQSRHFNGSHTEMFSPADKNATYIVFQGGVTQRVNDTLRDATTGRASDPCQKRTGSERLQRAMDEIRSTKETKATLAADEETEVILDTDVLWKAINGTAEKYENTILNTTPTVYGTAWKSETYVKVRWAWLTFLIVQVWLSIVILIMVIGETATAGIDIVKSSTLPSLFAINSEAKADLEHKFEEGEPLVEKGHRRVVPWGIGGQLHKVDGKWQLRSAGE